MNDIPRRACQNKLTKEEKAIDKIVQQVEKLGADIQLTNCVDYLSRAKNFLSNWVDAQKTLKQQKS